MKRMYLIWLIIYLAVWALAFHEAISLLNIERLLGASLFFIMLFILPLFAGKRHVQTALFCIMVLAAIIFYYPFDDVMNPYVFIIQVLIIAEAVYYLPRLNSYLVIAIQIVSMLWLATMFSMTISELVWASTLYLLIVLALFYFQSITKQKNEVQMKYDALLDEYRKMKRQLVVEEEQTRQDERMLIGHEIHDSVGHKLTALLVQFEAFRLTAAEQDMEKIEMLKELAEQSLEETRRAVKSFKQKEVGGLQGVIRLIRKLEMESFMKIHFSVKHGAFAAPLTGEQSFAIYRAVQEAMTNIMKHSATREAQIMFESPGGSIFRFEVTNPTSSNLFFQEGYGLKAMRERLENVGGSLEIHHDERQFVVRGSIRLTTTEGKA